MVKEQKQMAGRKKKLSCKKISPLTRRMRSQAGQTTTEYLLMISVIVIAVVGLGFVFAPKIEFGSMKLGDDVIDLADKGCADGWNCTESR